MPWRWDWSEVTGARLRIRTILPITTCTFSGHFTVGAAYYMLVPIYPLEAEDRGATPGQYGLVKITSK